MRNIVLTGFMGTGKTSVGLELARITGMSLVDVDEEIEKSEGVAIKEIFATRGEPAFRDIETGMVRELSSRENLIVSTGGGVVLRDENMAALREGGVVVCLSASPETILARTSENSDRPLLAVDDPYAKIKEMLDYRRPYYEKADIMIDTEGKSPIEVAEEILDRIRWKT